MSRLLQVEPQLFVTDLSRALAYYTQALGFELGFAYGEPAFYAQVRRDGVALNLRQVDRPALDHGVDADLLSAAITVSNARDLFEQYRRAGVTFRQPLARQPWHAEGQGAFIVEDPDGNLLLFAGATE